MEEEPAAKHVITHMVNNPPLKSTKTSPNDVCGFADCDYDVGRSGKEGLERPILGLDVFCSHYVETLTKKRTASS